MFSIWPNSCCWERDDFLKFFKKKERKKQTPSSCLMQEILPLEIRCTQLPQLSASLVFLHSLFNIKCKSLNVDKSMNTTFSLKWLHFGLIYRRKCSDKETHSRWNSVITSGTSRPFETAACVSSQKSVTHAAKQAVNILISQHWNGGISYKMLEMERMKLETACLAQLRNKSLQQTS